MPANNSSLRQLVSRFGMSVSSLIGLCLSLITTIIVSHDLSISERSDYGISTVTLMQVLMIIQLGLPGAFNIVGSSFFKVDYARDFYSLYRVRIMAFISVAIVFYLVSHKSALIIFCAIISGVFLIPAQWLSNALQKDLPIEILALLRLIPVIFQLISLLIARALNHGHLFGYLSSWIFGNIIYFVILAIVVNTRELAPGANDVQFKFTDIKKLAISGFIPHVSLQEIFRLELFIIPIMKNQLYAASFFIVFGISNWPKLICDSVAITNFQNYKSGMSYLEKSVHIKRISKQVMLVALTSTLVNTILFRFLLRFFPISYHPVFWSVVPFTLGATFSASRRLYLDLLRSRGIKTSKYASRIEALSSLPILLAVSTLFFNWSLSSWSWVWCISTFIGLLVTFWKISGYED